jgi:hypothetical protein
MSRAICRLASQETPRLQHEKTGPARRAGYASGRLATPPRGDWSRTMETKLPNGCLTKSGTAPTRTAEAQDRSDERHDHDRPMRGRRPFPTAGSEAKEKGYALQMPARGKGTL